MRKRNKENHIKLLPFHIIEAAASGNIEAIDEVLKHYRGYIIKLSTRIYYDEYGRGHYYVDETLRLRLENKLIRKALALKL